MPSNALRIEKVLSDDEYAAIDAFASEAEGRGAEALPKLAGFLKEDLGKEDKQELHALINDYRAGRVPLVTPLIP